MLDLKKWMTKVTDALKVDYIIEQGTSGIWTYRKWNSGIAECWGRYTATLTDYVTVGSFYGYYAMIAFPSGLYVSGTIPTHTYTSSVGNGFAWTGSGISTSNTDITLYALAMSSGSQSCAFDIVAKGRWKLGGVARKLLNTLKILASERRWVFC